MAGNVTAREISNASLVQGNKLENLILTLGAALTVDADSPQVLFLDPGGAGRNVDLPAEETSKGLFFIIVNTADAAEALTIRNDAAGTVGSVTQNEAAFCICNRTARKVYGWVA
jgi:hypothetical protein